ncbi:hypothetical protein [Saccharothrix algeriensis]|uniref:Rossmann fold nucleotide-binding protein DprA/Smf involved in DNA uptake n=1 Tax=Saccharothrix algeriensis TaxID=173560 RepID=A0A8T8HVF3_9PSEU|nr:hypothetical protein [Saccharothrix algeriensis]MBM7814057.1 putative Rossmann fold nucleotide-binding protein DprA/Smf involved in DNA uptake [Saccharothrix algeriensis]QTR02456.1 hypothetical protein J7S33_25500 [Saccharothrix algeriensis]
MRVGITGHSNLVPDCADAVRTAVRTALEAEVAGRSPLVGVTCLAPGADQLFARAVLELGGRVEAVLPAADYRDRLKPERRAEYDELLAAAHVVSALPNEVSGRQAYVMANERMLASVELLIAVWDGNPPDGRGGTADVVETARASGVPVVVVWPEEARRKS